MKIQTTRLNRSQPKMDKSENKEKNTNMSGYVMQGSLETGEISNVSFLIIERET